MSTSSARTVAAAFEFALTGPPRIYAVLSSTNLADWSELTTVTNQRGSAGFPTRKPTSLRGSFTALSLHPRG